VIEIGERLRAGKRGRTIPEPSGGDGGISPSGCLGKPGITVKAYTASVIRREDKRIHCGGI